MTRYKVGTVVWGIIFIFFFIGFIPNFASFDLANKIMAMILTGIPGLGLLINIIFLVMSVKKQKTNSQQTSVTKITQLNQQINGLANRTDSVSIPKQATNTMHPISNTLQNETAKSYVPQPASPESPTNTQSILYRNTPTPTSQVTAVSKITLETLCSRIPKEIVNLLWFSNGPLQNYSGESDELSFDFAGHRIHIKTSIRNEPSAIDVNLPLSDTPDTTTPLGYYPSYNGLMPQQRTAYFKWLADITVPVDIGFVFLFYYGLERHLLFGDSINAFATILTLRQFHKNNSFLNYSGDAIVLYSLAYNRWDVLQNLNVEQLSVDLHLLVAVHINKSLSAKDIMRTYKKFGFENNRYIKNDPELFLSTLESLLINQYSVVDFPVSDDDLVSAKGNIQLMLANYSLLPEQRFFELPDIATSPRVHDEINVLLVNTHETVKAKLREQRKKQ